MLVNSNPECIGDNQEVFWGEGWACHPSDLCNTLPAAPAGLMLRSLVPEVSPRSLNFRDFSASSWDAANTVYLKNTKPLRFLDSKEKSLVSKYYVSEIPHLETYDQLFMEMFVISKCEVVMIELCAVWSLPSKNVPLPWVFFPEHMVVIY